MKRLTSPEVVTGVVLALVLCTLTSLSVIRSPLLLSSGHIHLAAIVAANVVSETNDIRAEHGAQVLLYDKKLAYLATKKAEDMAQKAYFAHTSPEGRSPWYWLEESGYAYSYAGENLAMNFSESEDVIHAWTASPAHYANMIKPEFTHVGIGMAEGLFEGKKTMFVVQLFTQPEILQTHIAVPALIRDAVQKITPVAEAVVATKNVITPVTFSNTPTLSYLEYVQLHMYWLILLFISVFFCLSCTVHFIQRIDVPVHKKKHIHGAKIIIGASLLCALFVVYIHNGGVVVPADTQFASTIQSISLQLP
jgi:Cysteine-rich secretory protein family